MMGQICYYVLLQSGGRIILQSGGRIRLHVDCITVGRGRIRRKKPWLSPDWWYDKRAEEAEETLAEELRAAVARDTQAFAREKQILVENTRMMFAEEAIDKQIAEEQEERDSKQQQRERAYFALEMGKASDIRDVSDENALRSNAQRRATLALQAKDAVVSKQATIKKQRLMNLERANIAREKKIEKANLDEKKKAERAEAINQARLKSLKKARSAQKRKKKKEAKRADEIKKARLKNLKKARAAKKRKGKKHDA